MTKTPRWMMSTLLKRAPDGWVWRVRFNGQSWGGIRVERKDAVAMIRGRMIALVTEEP